MERFIKSIKKYYLAYKDFFPADLWAMVIMILMFIILGLIFLT